jgi:excisionase family DNA binding protein
MEPAGLSERLFLSLPEAAKRLGNVSAETLYRLNREGHLPTRRIGRKLVISVRNLDRWADELGDVRDTSYQSGQ